MNNKAEIEDHLKTYCSGCKLPKYCCECLETKENKKELFPKVTSEFISLSINSVGKLADRISKNASQGLSTSDPLGDFLQQVVDSSIATKDYQKIINSYKMLLVMANRITALTASYTMGVAIGYFIAKPEAMPIVEDEEEKEKEII